MIWGSGFRVWGARSVPNPGGGIELHLATYIYIYIGTIETAGVWACGYVQATRTRMASKTQAGPVRHLAVQEWSEILLEVRIIHNQKL